MKLAEALLLLPELEEELRDLQRLRRKVATVSYDEARKEATITQHDTTVDEVTEQIKEVSRKIRDLRLHISRINSTHTINWAEDGRQITLGEAVILIQQKRIELLHIEDLSETQTTSRIVAPIDEMNGNMAKDWTYREITKANFDVKKYKRLVKSLKAEIMKLESIIQLTNWSIDIPELAYLDNNSR